MVITLQGRSISGGWAEGEALVCREPMGFNFGVNTENGIITENNHPLQGRSIKDKVLIFPYGKGSTGGSFVIYQLAKNKTGPIAMINVTTETIIAVGAIMGGIPVVDSLDQNPLDVMADGDFVRVDADRGTVQVTKRSHTGVQL